MKRVRWHSNERCVPVLCSKTRSRPVIHPCAMVSPAMIQISDTESRAAPTASRVVKQGFMLLAAAAVEANKSTASHRWLHEWLTSEPQEFSLRGAGKDGLVTLSCPWCWTSAGLKLSAVLGAELVLRFHSAPSVLLNQWWEGGPLGAVCGAETVQRLRSALSVVLNGHKLSISCSLLAFGFFPDNRKMHNYRRTVTFCT